MPEAQWKVELLSAVGCILLTTTQHQTPQKIPEMGDLIREYTELLQQQVKRRFHRMIRHRTNLEF